MNLWIVKCISQNAVLPTKFFRGKKLKCNYAHIFKAKVEERETEIRESVININLLCSVS